VRSAEKSKSFEWNVNKLIGEPIYNRKIL